MSGYIGTQPVPQATQTRDAFTATSGQTSFATSGYTPTFLDVYLNGIFLANGADYTASNGSDVVLATGAATGDILEVVAYTTFEISGVAGLTPSIDDNGNSTAITIDSSENVLVGTTNVNIRDSSTNDGLVYRTGNSLDVTNNGNTVAIFNRNISDGDIVTFRKGAADVGSIGTQGSRLSIGSGDVNLNFNASANSMYPISNPTTGALSDGAINVGAATARFKDLYLSGGVFLGGTGAANKLDDYEEGTWTPSIAAGGFSGATGTAYYTKIGRVVNVIWEGAIQGTGTSVLLKIGGLPFSAVTWSAGSMYARYYTDEGSQLVTVAVRTGDTNLAFVTWGDEASGDKFSAGYFAINITYNTAS